MNNSNWKDIFNAGLITNTDGNGHSDTTEKFDNNIWCFKERPTLVAIKNILYEVQYMDGCFYPIWSIAKDQTASPNFTIKKAGEIIRN